MWSKNPLSAAHWYLDITLKVTGRVKSGADGMVSVMVVVCLVAWKLDGRGEY